MKEEFQKKKKNFQMEEVNRTKSLKKTDRVIRRL